MSCAGWKGLEGLETTPVAVEARPPLPQGEGWCEERPRMERMLGERSALAGSWLTGASGEKGS